MLHININCPQMIFAAFTYIFVWFYFMYCHFTARKQKTFHSTANLDTSKRASILATWQVSYGFQKGLDSNCEPVFKALRREIF